MSLFVPFRFIVFFNLLPFSDHVLPAFPSTTCWDLPSPAPHQMPTLMSTSSFCCRENQSRQIVCECGHMHMPLPTRACLCRSTRNRYMHILHVWRKLYYKEVKSNFVLKLLLTVMTKDLQSLQESWLLFPFIGWYIIGYDARSSIHTLLRRSEKRFILQRRNLIHHIVQTRVNKKTNTWCINIIIIKKCLFIIPALIRIVCCVDLIYRRFAFVENVVFSCVGCTDVTLVPLDSITLMLSINCVAFFLTLLSLWASTALTHILHILRNYVRYSRENAVKLENNEYTIMKM